MAFEQVFKQIDDKLRVDEGCATALDYVEQSSWKPGNTSCHATSIPS